MSFRFRLRDWESRVKQFFQAQLYDFNDATGPVLLPFLWKRLRITVIIGRQGKDRSMTRAHKIEVWIAAVVVPLVTVGVFALIRWQKQKAVTLRGAVVVPDADPRKQLPIGGVLISADVLKASPSKTDSSGFFALTFPKSIRRGYPIVLHYRHPQYRPLDVKDYVGNQLYIVHLVPLDDKPVPKDQPSAKLANVRVRYTEKTQTEFNVGSAVKTFQVENKGNIPCRKQHPCSPDGKWKAAFGAITIDAGVGNQFRAPRASCIAGPCPFTRMSRTRCCRPAASSL